MIKIYIYTSLIAMGLMILVDLRLLNKNIRTFIKKHRRNKTIWQRILSELKDMFGCWVPVFNIILIGLGLYLFFASEFKVIDLLRKIYKENQEDQEKIQKYLNE